MTLTDIIPGYKTDHLMIALSLHVSLHPNPRRAGFWKLKTSFKLNMEYVNQIKTMIQKRYDKYKNDESVNPSFPREMVKLKVCEKSFHYS